MGDPPSLAVPVEIRDYSDRDYEFVRRLFSAYLAEEKSRVEVLGIADDFPDQYLPGLIQKTREQGGLFLVAEQDRGQVGFVAVLPKDPQPWDPTHGKVAMIMELHVHPDHRRQGVGRQLFASAEKWAVTHGLVWATLGTFAANAAAHSFYAAMGYRPTYLFMGKPL